MGQLAFFAAALVGLVVVNWSTVKGWLPSFGKASGGRAGAISALDSVIEYFESQGCEEGAAAARLCGPHFWHQHGADVTA
jgi:hypothetical protein